MGEIVGSVFWFLVATSILITFHEFGHYWVARRFGVHVLRFSIGLGKPLWRRVAANGTEFVIAAVPLGGYVKFLDERDQEVPAHLRSGAFNAKPVGQRFLIVLAGPVFNLILALAVFWVMLMVGVRDYQPVVGDVTGLAQRAGLETGDRIVAIDEQPMSTWTHVLVDLTTKAYRDASVAITVEQANGNLTTRRLNLAEIDAVDESKFFEQVGVTPWHWNPPALVGFVAPGSPAERAGLRVGDSITAVGDKAVDRFVAMRDQLQIAAKAEGGTVRLSIRRGAMTETLLIKPDAIEEGGKTRYQIGIAPDGRATTRSYGPIAAMPAAVSEAWRMTVGSFKVIWHMIAGNAQLKNISGPISIAQFANYSAEGGLSKYLEFLALISLSLCIMNLLPIPVLDGGHLVYCAAEWLKGSPVSERTQLIGQYFGLAAILALMSLAFFNDISRLVAS